MAAKSPSAGEYGRVLVTGAAGFIGANLVRRLIADGASVIAPVRRDTNLWRLKDLLDEIELVETDLEDAGSVERTVVAARADIIFNLALPFGHPLIDLESQYVRSSVALTANLLEALAGVPFKRLVHFGSSLEYRQSESLLKETDPIDPSTGRGKAKVAQLNLVRRFAAAGHSVTILRPFSVYGPWEDSSRLLPTAILAALTGKSLDMTIPGFSRDFIFIEDVVEASLAAALNNEADGEIINIGTGRQYTNEEVVRAVSTLVGSDITIRTGNFTPRPSDTPFWAADIEKAKTLLGWEPLFTLESGLNKTISWFAENLGAYTAIGLC